MFNNKIHTLIFISIVLSILFLWKCSSTRSLKDKNAILHQNIEANLEKQAQVLKNKEGEYYTEKKSLMFTIKELKRINEELADEIVKYKGKFSNIQKINITGINDSLKLIYDTVFVSDFGKFHKNSWNIKDDLFIINGLTEIHLDTVPNDKKIKIKTNSKVVSYNIELDIYTGVIKEDGIWKSFVRSDNPNIKFNIASNLNPDIFAPKRKTFTFGPTFGVGVGLTGKNFVEPLSDMSIKPTIFIGIGFTYNLFSF